MFFSIDSFSSLSLSRFSLIALSFTLNLTLSKLICFWLWSLEISSLIWIICSFDLVISSSICKRINLSFSSSSGCRKTFTSCSFFNLLFSNLIFSYLSFIFVISLAIKETSIFSRLSFILIYFSASFFCFSNGFKEDITSLIIRFNLVIFSLVLSSFFKVSSFLFLYFNTPAAFSKSTLLSDDLLSTKALIFPWVIILNFEETSNIKSVISLSLTLELFIKYSFSPVL